ncbi:MAG: M23 family metallopeptidase [Myxococcaceae bacterium]
MPPLPKLGPQPKSPIPALITIALFIGLLSGGGYWLWKKRGAELLDQAGVPPETATAAVEGTPAAAATPTDVPQVPSLSPSVVPSPAPPGTPPSVGAGAPLTPTAKTAAGLQHVRVAVTGPLEQAFVAALGREVGPALTQVVARTLVWWIAMPGDLKRNDQIDVVYQEQPGQEPLVHAVSFVSGKTGQTHRAYRFRGDGAPFARFYEPTGEELELRLKPSPLDDYEQVTSLLRDGRKHKGVDFRTPVGTPVKATFTGTLTRKNWNFRGNGNCLELTASDGVRKALFLHLDVLPKSTAVGQRVEVGQVIANSGNSGHSFAPHLHYQLMRGEDHVLDPFAIHSTYRQTVPEAQRTPLQAAIKKLDGLMGVTPITANAAQ